MESGPRAYGTGLVTFVENALEASDEKLYFGMLHDRCSDLLAVESHSSNGGFSAADSRGGDAVELILEVLDMVGSLCLAMLIMIAIFKIVEVFI